MTTLDLSAVRLAFGPHENAAAGMCVMEMASILAGEEFGDSPACVSPVVGAFLRSWNDGMNDEDRQKLKPYAAAVIGTRTTDADEETRAWMATDWLVRVQTPAWLRLAGLTAEAQSLEALARITDATPARAAQPTIEGARGKAAAAWAAARDAAWAAAWAAATDALRPTVEVLQVSAFGLLDAMIAVGRTPAKEGV